MGRKARNRFVLVVFFFVLGAGTAELRADSPEPNRGIYRTKFEAAGKYLLVEILDDHLAHFEISAHLPGPGAQLPIATTPMIERRDYPGPTQLRRHGPRSNIIETAKLAIEVDTTSLCLSYRDKTRGGAPLTRICPLHLNEYWKGLTLARGEIRNFYGLGQEFRDPGQPDGDWMNRVRHFGALHGNKMVPFNGGDCGNTQVPILYALGTGHLNYALFLDQVYQQQWDFTSDPARVEMYGDHVRWYFMTGPSLHSLRQSYMDLVGRPLVPPRKAFGLWVSEYGYRNWGEVEGKLKTLRANHFPVDGFVLDLFWFGGIKSGSDETSMGRLAWDEKNFPSARKKLASLRDDEGIGIIPIEESYIGKNLLEHHELEQKGYLVKSENGKAAYLTSNGWWGRGGMMDWTNPEAGSYWHSKKRASLVEADVAGHWLDLGEPELYPSFGLYWGGLKQPDVHNIYNLKWIESVYRGYEAHSPQRRPFLLSRSGTAGIQRYGAVMWSGDIGANLDNLASHQNAQMHMSLSGMDYYGSDIGGFHRAALHGDLGEMYTQWMAYGSLFDIPARPHTENLCQCKETAPDRIGDLRSNRENLRWRYRLIPYVYSLAHRAYLHGEPVFPPPLYYFQSEPGLRTRGREKMIGPSLLAAVVARHGQSSTSVYLPRGKWMDFYTGRALESTGQTFDGISLRPEGYFRLPLYARAGAIIPMMIVDDKTMNATGRRMDGSRRDELVLRVFSDEATSEFTLFEDDGISTRYRKGEVRRTLLGQSRLKSKATVTIAPAQGSFEGAASSRNNVVELMHGAVNVERVLVDDRALPKRATKEAWESSEDGWFSESAERTLIKSGVADVTEEKRITVEWP